MPPLSDSYQILGFGLKVLMIVAAVLIILYYVVKFLMKEWKKWYEDYVKVMKP